MSKDQNRYPNPPGEDPFFWDMSDDEPMLPPPKSKIPKKGTFYLIWNPSSERPPCKVFCVKKVAIKVAKAMAKKYREKFYICQVTEVCQFNKKRASVRELWG